MPIVHRAAVPAALATPARGALVLALVCLLALAPARAANAADTDGARHAQPGLLVVTGTGEVERAPDRARITVAVIARGESVAAVVAANREASAAALARIEALDIPREDVATLDFQVFETPDEFTRDFTRDGRPRERPPFTASHRLSILLREVDRAGEVAGEILDGEAMTFQGISFELERSREAQDEALRRAVADARRQAEVLAQAAGVGLGRIVRIGDAEPRFPRPEMAFRAVASDALPIVPPATLSWSATTSLTFELGEE